MPQVVKIINKGGSMKETGIMMSGNHPKLVLDGLKTQTRRTYGLEKLNKNPGKVKFLGVVQNGYYQFDIQSPLDIPSHGYIGIKCAVPADATDNDRARI